jgi:hypothetical protein
MKPYFIFIGHPVFVCGLFRYVGQYRCAVLYQHGMPLILLPVKLILFWLVMEVCSL